jgi:hypothetical protein
MDKQKLRKEKEKMNRKRKERDKYYLCNVGGKEIQKTWKE